jgi:uncharacterized protein (DUF1800 family)
LRQLQVTWSAQAFAGLPASADYLVRESRFRMARREQKRGDADADGAMNFRTTFGADLIAEVTARWRVATTTANGFHERIVRFWSNHFAVSVDKGPAGLYAAPMEREAIRPHATGSFADLLFAVETHPAMLRYLDNALSTGPDSPLASRLRARDAKRKGGLNENLAREILELHTLGVDGGYTQADVTELARAITGWSLPAPRDLAAGNTPADNGFVFRPGMHEGGARMVLGKRYAEDGLAQGRAILADLALQPKTARHVSLKIARHFVADDPPPALVARMQDAWLAHDGQLAPVFRTLIESAESWRDDAEKFKSPQDFLVSALRATRIDAGVGVRQFAGLLDRLGQPDFKPRSPAGFPDTGADWLQADALGKRIQAAEALAERAPRDGVQPEALARDVLGARLDDETATALRRAASPQQAIATLLAAPAFQWRT